jgi:hypothetical protein
MRKIWLLLLLGASNNAPASVRLFDASQVSVPSLRTKAVELRTSLSTPVGMHSFTVTANDPVQIRRTFSFPISITVTPRNPVYTWKEIVAASDIAMGITADGRLISWGHPRVHLSGTQFGHGLKI